MNPLVSPFQTPYETVPFDKIENKHFLPAIEQGITKAKEEIQLIVENPEKANFSNTIEALDSCGTLLDRVTAVFFNLNSAETSDEIQALAREISPKLTEHSNDILLNEKLFTRVNAVWESKDSLELDTEQKTLLEKTYKGFVRNGAKLKEDAKEQLRTIDKELSQLSLQFGENVLKETNDFIQLQKWNF